MSPVPFGAGLFLEKITKDNPNKMKRTVLITLVSILTTIQATAQVTNGFYRIQNYATTRYITINDDIIGKVNTSSTDIDLANIVTWRGFDHVKSSPASIFYVEQVGSQYNLKSQGTSIYQIAGGKTYLDLIAKDDNTYMMSASYGGASARLYDTSKDIDEGYVHKSASSGADYGRWRFIPVTDGDNYLGLQPTVQTNDGWYGTVYASYPFKVVSSGISVYVVDGVKDGVFQLLEITDEIKPAATPLLFKCASGDAADNKIMPVTEEGFAVNNNCLGGTYFASTTNKHKKYVEYDSKTMRVLGKNADGNLIFTTATTDDLSEKKYIPKNTCWLNVPDGLTGDFKLVSREEYTTGIRNINADTKINKADDTIYTLTGTKANAKTLRPGIYIKDGKKLVIK